MKHPAVSASTPKYLLHLTEPVPCLRSVSVAWLFNQGPVTGKDWFILVVVVIFGEEQREGYAWCVRDAHAGVHSTSQYKFC